MSDGIVIELPLLPPPLIEFQNAIRDELVLHRAEIDQRLSLFGLSFGDMSSSLHGIVTGNETVYYFEKHPILAMRVIFSDPISVKIRVLSD